MQRLLWSNYIMTLLEFEYPMNNPSITSFLWIPTLTYMWYQLETRILILLQHLSNFSKTNKNELYPPLSRSTPLNDVLQLSPIPRNTAPSLNNTLPSFNLKFTTMEYYTLSTLWNILILANPSRYPNGSTASKANLHNITKIVLLVYSLIPLLMITYQSQTDSSDLSCTYPSKISLTTSTTIVIAIAIMVELK